MTGASATSSRRRRGEIEKLPSGSLWMRVYAGVDALSGKRNYLIEMVPAGPRVAAETKKVRTRLVNQVDEQRNPRTTATRRSCGGATHTVTAARSWITG